MPSIFRRLTSSLQKSRWKLDFPATASESDILYCFRLLLGRVPAKQEWPGHSAHAGEDLATVVASYLSSEEFARRRLLSRATGAWQLVELPRFKMYAEREDAFIGKVILDRQEYEPHVTRVFQQYLRPGMVVLDIGANIGYFSLLSASLVGATGFVYCWEPSPANVKMLYASQLVNRFGNMEIVQAAASDTTNLLRYSSSSSNGQVANIQDPRPEDVLSAELVMGLRVDDFLPKDRHVDFMKIDVEGYEFKAVKGALKTLERCRPVVVTEFSPDTMKYFSDATGQQYLELFTERGYDIFVIGHSGVTERTVAEALADFEESGTDHIDLLLRPQAVEGR